MIGSKKVVTQKYFLSSQDKMIHKYPVLDEHVKYAGEKIFDGPEWYERMRDEEKKGKTANSCPKCLKGFSTF